MSWPGAFAIVGFSFAIFGSFAVSDYSKNMANAEITRLAVENAKLAQMTCEKSKQ